MSVFTKYGGDDFVHRSFLDIASRSLEENMGRFGVGGGVTGLALGALGGEIYGDRDLNTVIGAGIGLATGASIGTGLAYKLKPTANKYTRGVVKSYDLSLASLWDNTYQSVISDPNLPTHIRESSEALEEYASELYARAAQRKANYYSTTYQPTAMSLGMDIPVAEDRKKIYRFTPTIAGG